MDELASCVLCRMLAKLDCLQASQQDVRLTCRDSMQELGWKRSDYVLSTKIFWGGKGVNDKGLSRKHIIEGMKVSRPSLQSA